MLRCAPRYSDGPSCMLWRRTAGSGQGPGTALGGEGGAPDRLPAQHAITSMHSTGTRFHAEDAMEPAPKCERLTA